jgi:hypothetical protein
MSQRAIDQPSIEILGESLFVTVDGVSRAMPKDLNVANVKDLKHLARALGISGVSKITQINRETFLPAIRHGLESADIRPRAVAVVSEKKSVPVPAPLPAPPKLKHDYTKLPPSYENPKGYYNVNEFLSQTGSYEYWTETVIAALKQAAEQDPDDIFIIHCVNAIIERMFIIDESEISRLADIMIPPSKLHLRPQIEASALQIVNNKMREHKSCFTAGINAHEVKEIMETTGIPKELAEMVAVYSQGVRLPPSRLTNRAIRVVGDDCEIINTDTREVKYVYTSGDPVENLTFAITAMMGYPIPPDPTGLELKLIWSAIVRKHHID